MDLSFAVYTVQGTRAKEKQAHAQFQKYTTLTEVSLLTTVNAAFTCIWKREKIFNF